MTLHSLVSTFSHKLVVNSLLAVFVAGTIPKLAIGQPSLLALEEQAIANAVSSASESIVQIQTIGGLEHVEQVAVSKGPTSGVVVSQDGYILSSAYGFAQHPTSVLVTLHSGNQLPAEIIATDHSRMLVLLKIHSEESLPVPMIAASSSIQVGSTAIAAGKIFHTDQPNVTVGIVSATKRLFGKVVQTDAAISAANYGGALIDLHGRVMGIIVPMSPGKASEVAGVEWYDSGIGFAVPLSEIQPAIERMKQGVDQYPGKLGIGFENDNPFVGLPTISKIRPRSPAALIGLQSGDVITSFNGQPVNTVTDLRYAIGPLYAGESVTLSVSRKGKKFTKELILTSGEQKLSRPFLGILPQQIDSDTVEVRAVFSGSPAAQQGVHSGDHITHIDDQEISDLSDVYTALAQIGADDRCTLTIRRDNTSLKLNCQTSQVPTTLMSGLPPAKQLPKPKAVTRSAAIDSLTLPQFKNQCQVYIPQPTSSKSQVAVIIFLGSSANEVTDALSINSVSACDQFGIAMVVPQALAQTGWQRSDYKYLRSLVSYIIKNPAIDAERIAVHGEGAGQELALLLGLLQPDEIRGVSLADGQVPRGLKIPQSDGRTRLDFLAWLPNESNAKSLSRQGLRKIVEAGYPISIALPVPEDGTNNNKYELLWNWSDSLSYF